MRTLTSTIFGDDKSVVVGKDIDVVFDGSIDVDGGDGKGAQKSVKFSVKRSTRLK